MKNILQAIKSCLNGLRMYVDKTADKAQAIADNAPVYITITSTDSGYQSTHSYSDIKTIIESGKVVYAVHGDRVYPFDRERGDPDRYIFSFYRFDEVDSFIYDEYGDVFRSTRYEQDSPLNYFTMQGEDSSVTKTYKVTIKDGEFVITEL